LAFDRVFEVLSSKDTNGEESAPEAAVTMDGVEGERDVVDDTANVRSRHEKKPELQFGEVWFRYRTFSDLAIGSLSQSMASTDPFAQTTRSGPEMHGSSKEFLCL